MFQAPNKLYDSTADEINSNIMRVNIKDSFEQPVDMTNIGVSVFIKSQRRDPKTDEHFIIETLNPQNSLKIHRFNRTVPETSLVLVFWVVDPKLSLRVFLSVGKQPTLKKYRLTSTLTARNFTNKDSSFSLVISHDMLRNIAGKSKSQEFFLGVMWNGELRAGNKSYTLRVVWTKCLILEEDGAWKSSGCEVSSSHKEGIY